MSRSWLLYLDDLIESAEKIGRLVAGRKYSTFTSDESDSDLRSAVRTQSTHSGKLFMARALQPRPAPWIHSQVKV